jgi:adenylate cyclase
MPLEIERKFLVSGDAWRAAPYTYICQAYLNHDKRRTVRVRIAGESAWLTIKGETSGATRAEFEYQVPLADARQMLLLCEPAAIEKHRHVVDYAGHVWEIDEFLGANQGLVVAEIELDSENAPFERPDWVGKEVTDDPRYYNSNLSRQPYSTWSEKA